MTTPKTPKDNVTFGLVHEITTAGVGEIVERLKGVTRMRQIGEHVPETKSRYGLSWLINGGGPPDDSVWTDLGDYWFITHPENVCYVPGDYYLLRKANILEYDFDMTEELSDGGAND